jgi:hypothetical protein
MPIILISLAHQPVLKGYKDFSVINVQENNAPVVFISMIYYFLGFISDSEKSIN